MLSAHDGGALPEPSAGARDAAATRGADQLGPLLDQLVDHAIYTLDPDGLITSWNGGAQRLKGYTADEAIGRSFTRFYSPADRLAGLPSELLQIAARDGVVHQTGWRYRKGGERFWCTVTITALHDDDGRLTGYGKITRDLSQEQRDEDARERYVAAIAHDLRSPLTALLGFVELARDQHHPVRGAWLDRAEESGRRVIAMLDDLVTGLPGAVHRRVAHPNQLDVVDLATTVRDSLPPSAEGERVHLPDHRLLAWGDQTAMERVLTNLVVNALKYSDAGPVSIDAYRVGDRVRLTVADRGRGIDPADVPRVFERGFRGRLATDDGGHGVGLASVRDLAEAQHGRVWVSSELGVGTVVTVELPATAPG